MLESVSLELLEEALLLADARAAKMAPKSPSPEGGDGGTLACAEVSMLSELTDGSGFCGAKMLDSADNGMEALLEMELTLMTGSWNEFAPLDSSASSRPSKRLSKSTVGKFVQRLVKIRPIFRVIALVDGARIAATMTARQFLAGRRREWATNGRSVSGVAP